ncbi:MAG: DedA family protein [Lentisphaeria bacterium]|jgi:membrane protein DedA with SNARE-associated domain
MTHILVEHLESFTVLAKTWGPLLIFLFMMIESSCIPFPSEVVMIPAGFMAARLDLFPGTPIAALAIAIAAGILGSLAGAYINYYLSMKLGRKFLYAYGKYFFLKPTALERAEEIFREYGDMATFVCRLLPAIRQLISIPAGLSKMHFGRFTLFTGLGAGIWVIVLTGMGYYFGKQTTEMSYEELVLTCKHQIGANLPWLVLGLAVSAVVYVWVHRKVMHRHTAEPS